MPCLRMLVLAVAFTTIGGSEAIAQAGGSIERTDLAAALAPGARVRVRARFGTEAQVGVVGSRSGDTLAIHIWRSGAFARKPLVIRIPDTQQLDVSGGLEAPSGTRELVARMLLGGAIAGGLTVAAFGDAASAGIVAARAGAGALLFGLVAPRAKPRERWLPVHAPGAR